MLRGKKILITSGPTRAPLDAIRFLSNVSTGRFGTLLAEEALKRGAEVTFIFGKGSQTPKNHPRLKTITVETNNDVARALRQNLTRQHYNVVVHAMAVLDFQPARIRQGKTKTKRGHWILKLIPTPKIILQVKRWSPKTLLVGFKLEIGISKEALLKETRRLLKQSKADFVLANQLTEGADAKHMGFLLNKAGHIVAQAKGKKSLAKLILDLLEEGGSSRSERRKGGTF